MNRGSFPMFEVGGSTMFNLPPHSRNGRFNQPRIFFKHNCINLQKSQDWPLTEILEAVETFGIYSDPVMRAIAKRLYCFEIGLPHSQFDQIEQLYTVSQGGVK